MGAVASSFLAIPLIFVLSTVATGAGRRIASLLLPDASPGEHSILGFPVGMALVSLLTTGVLFAKLPAATLLYVLLGALLAALVWARSDIVELLEGLRGFARESPLLAAAAGFAGIFGLAGCLAPETGWDTGVYHFTMARLRAEQGGMLVRLDIPHGYRPAYMESLYCAGFVLNGETLASLINGGFYFGGLALARLWGTQLAGARGGLFAGLAWLSSATFVLRMDGGDVEVGQAVYLGTAMLALGKLREGGRGGWRVLAGGALGMLLGIKYASIYAVAVLAVVWVVLRLLDRASGRAIAADGLVIGGLGLLIACPWYLRNYRLTGSPIYPFQATGDSLWTGEATSEEGVGRVVLQVLGMDVFVLAGVAALAMPAGARLRWAGIVSIVSVIWIQGRMGFSPAQILNGARYASQAWMPLLVLGGVAVADSFQRPKLWNRAALGAVMVALAIGQGIHAYRNARKLPVALGLRSRELYLEDRVSTYRAIRDAEARLPAGKKLLLVEERSYYCRAPFLAASDLQQRVNFDGLKTSSDVRRFLQDESIGAIVVDRSPQAKTWRFRALEERLGADWPVPGVRRVDTRGDASLYLVD
jgi:hypothetical protein